MSDTRTRPAQRAATYEDLLAVRTHVARLGAASVTFHSEVVRVEGETPIATATVELACIDLRNRERGPIALPDDLRALLA